MTLTDRYITAAVAGVPEPARDDVAEELQASVADAVDALVAGGLTPQEAEVRALTDLGDPAVLAERFGGRPRHLIGPAYYGSYTQLLRILLMVIVPIAGVATVLAKGFSGASPIDGVLSALGTMLQVAVHIVFWVTVVFVVLERTDTPLPAKQWTPDDLPAVVERRIKVSDVAGSVSWLVLLIWLMIWQRDNWLLTVDGEQVPFLNPDIWTPWLLLLLGVMVAALVLEIVKFRTGRWTVPLAIVNTILNAAFAGIVVWLWSAGTLLSPGVTGLWLWMGWLPWVVVLIAVLDTLGGWWALLRR